MKKNISPSEPPAAEESSQPSGGGAWTRCKRALESIARIKALRLLIPIFVIGLVYFEGHHLFRTIHPGALLRELRCLPRSSLLALLLAGLAAAASMSGYDFVIRRQFKLGTSVWTTFRYAWISNTSNNVLGFAGVTGAGIRTLLYRSAGVPVTTAARAVIFLSPIVAAGLSVLAWGNVTGLFHADKLTDAHPWLTPALWGMALYVPLFLLAQRSRLYARWFGKRETQLSWGMIAAGTTASLLEWLSAGLVFALAAHIIMPGIPLPTLLGLYIASATAGLISLAPGGIGAFDLLAVLGLQLYGDHGSRALAVLLLFRLFYYLIPWVIGLAMAALEIFPHRMRKNIKGAR